MKTIAIACCLAVAILGACRDGDGSTDGAQRGEPFSDPTAEAACPQEITRLGYLEGSWSVHASERVAMDRDEWTEGRGRAQWKLREKLCLWSEEWERTLDGETLYGLRLLAYDRRAETWNLGEIDSGHGNLILVDGYGEGGRLVFQSAHRRAGRLLLDRVELVPRDRDRFDWTIETSLDGGDTWTVLLRQRYVRVVEAYRGQ